MVGGGDICEILGRQHGIGEDEGEMETSRRGRGGGQRGVAQGQEKGLSELWW